MAATDPEKAAQEPIPQIQDQIADIGSETQQKNKSSASKPLNFGSLVLYFQLLVSASPTWIDILLLVAGALAAAAAGTPFPLMGILFGELVDNVNSATCEASEKGTSDSYASAIQSKVLQLVYVSIAAFILIYAYISSWSLVSQRLAHRLRESYFKSLLRQDISFFDDRHAGEVSARLNGDIQAIQSGTGEKVGIFIASISFFVTAYIIAFIKQPDLAGILVSLVPACLLMSLVGGAFVQKFAGIASDAIAAGSSIASEALSNVAVVQTFGMGRRLEAKFAADMLIARKAGIKKAITSATQAGLLFFIAYSANALAFWQGSRKIAAAAEGNGDASVGRIYTVVFLLVDACVILGSVAPLLPLFGGASSAFERLKKDINTLSRIDGTLEEGQCLQPDISGGVDFRGVSFSYPSRPNHLVLRQVDLHFPAGKYTAIVGLSGSGKSTVASLLTRLYDPIEGNILLDGHDLRGLNVRQLRGLVGVVQQEPSLFDRSVFENIALGLVNSSLESHQSLQPLLLSPKLSTIAENADPEAYDDPRTQELIRLVRHASNLAEVSTFIPKLENGYATVVGSGGQLVSGGQRQRIALARALIKDPKILVLDEATASLDSATEQRIQVAIERVAVNRTVISIAHRLSTIKGADSIIVMKGGEVVEQGTYDELVTLDGVFAGMVSLQALPNREGGSVMSSRNSKASLDEKVEVVSVDAESSPTKEAPTPISSDAKPETEAKQLRRRMLREVGGLLRPYLAWLALAVIAAIIVGSTFSGSGLIFGNAVGALGPCSNSPSRIRWAGMFFGGLFFMLAVVEFFANLASWSSFGIVAEKLVYRARVLSFRSLFEQGVEWHRSNGRSPSSLLSIITNDSVALNGFSGSIIGTIFGVVVNILVAVILSHIIAWKIALVFLVTVPILLGAGIMQLRALTRFQERHADAFSKAIGISVEAVGQIKNVAVLGLENEVFAMYTRALAAPRRDIVGVSFYTNFWLAISNSTGFLIYAFAYWWGSKLIMKGEYTQTQFFIILIAILVSAQLWGQMFSLAPEISRAKNATQRIVELTNLVSDKRVGDGEDNRKNNDIESAPESSSRPLGDQHKGASVTFSNVSFAYPSRPDRPVLKDISFRIQPGQFVGLVGPSGAGKSTIMGLAQQLYAPTTGSISLDGSYSLAGYKDDIAVVPQDSALFSGSIKFNVGLGSRQGTEATLEEIEEACKLANIHDVIISLPDGYETDCGPSAGRLSGGQRQRLAIARALVRRPRLLLLDESTSALDAESEAAVQEGLSRAVRERGVTILAITHRLHTVMRADMIIVVEGGRIVDVGTHSELVERCESYRQNATGQMLSKGVIEG